MNTRIFRSASNRSLGALCSLLLIFGCQQPATEDRPESHEEALAAIGEQAKSFSDAYVRGDIDELVSIYTENGVAAPGGSEFVIGRSDMRSFWTISAGTKILRHKTTSESLVVDGNHAYDWGFYEGQTEQDGQTLPPFRGKYVIVWEEGEDGVWRMAVDMWNSLPPTPSKE